MDTRSFPGKTMAAKTGSQSMSWKCEGTNTSYIYGMKKGCYPYDHTNPTDEYKTHIYL